jgi:hypothetical protein
MLRWGFGGKSNKKDAEQAAATPAAPVDDELAFLRGRADFDEEEMSSVRSVDDDGVASHGRTAAAPVNDEWSFLRSRAQEDGIASVFTPPVEPAPGVVPVPAAPVEKPSLSAEDHRIKGALQAATGAPPDLSEEDLRIGDLLQEAMGYPTDAQGEAGR